MAHPVLAYFHAPREPEAQTPFLGLVFLTTSTSSRENRLRGRSKTLLRHKGVPLTWAHLVLSRKEKKQEGGSGAEGVGLSIRWAALRNELLCPSPAGMRFMAEKIRETGHRRTKPACLQKDIRPGLCLEPQPRSVPPMPGSSQDFRA